MAADHSSRYQYTSSSLMSLTTGIAYQDPRFHLHLVLKKDLASERPMIPSTKSQRLSFYRSYTSTPSKTEIFARQSVNINSFLWCYTMDVFFKTIPHSFVHFFMASYAPEQHMFVTKMVPFSFGLKFLFAIVGFLEIMSNMDLTVLLLHYFLAGLLLKNPWNRCPEPSIFFDKRLNATVRCFTLEEFPRIFENRSFEYFEFTFIYQKYYHFQVAQIEYYRQKVYDVEHFDQIVEYMFLFAAVTFFHLHVKYKYFWKLLHWAQWSVNIVDLIIMAYLTLLKYNDKEIVKMSKIYDVDKNADTLTYPDIEMLAESITGPSIIHVLTSRSSQEIDPSRDSTSMVISNALIFIFRGLLTSSLQTHCEKMCHAEIPVTQFNHHSFFYFIPMFFTSFYLGDIYGLVYIFLYLMTEFMLIVVIYACVVECIIYEWKFVKRYMVMGVFGGIGAVMNIFTSVDCRVLLWIYGKSIATLSETICIYILYPVGRLVDDFTFHYGVGPTKLRILSLRLVPVFYAFKMYIMLTFIWDKMAVTGLVEHFRWSWSLMVLPILLGNLYIVYRYLGVFRMTWNYIFRPVPKWGPIDFSVRQLRKQFDSRYYIGSEVPRLLSRYLMSKRESKVYKVDVRYDFYRRSTVTGAMAVRFGAEQAK